MVDEPLTDVFVYLVHPIFVANCQRELLIFRSHFRIISTFLCLRSYMPLRLVFVLNLEIKDKVEDIRNSRSVRMTLHIANDCIQDLKVECSH